MKADTHSFQPIHIVRLDERTLNLFILAGQGEEIELEIKPDGNIEPWHT